MTCSTCVGRSSGASRAFRAAAVHFPNQERQDRPRIGPPKNPTSTQALQQRVGMLASTGPGAPNEGQPVIAVLPAVRRKSEDLLP